MDSGFNMLGDFQESAQRTDFLGKGAESTHGPLEAKGRFSRMN